VGGWALLLGVLLSGCATLADIAATPATPLRPTDPARLVGRWEGQVDLTFPDRTLVVHGVSRKNDAWVAQLEYGTTGVYLNSVAGVVDETGGQLTLRFVTPLASAVRLTLHTDTVLRGTFRLPTEDQDRPIELKRVARGGEPVPSTALDRVSKAAAAPPASTRSTAARPEAPATATAPPLAPSAERDLAAVLPKLLTGRWEGELDFTVSARLLLIDSVKREGDAWVVVARSGVSEADLVPVPVTIDTSQDRVVVRYNTSFASRAVLTLHTDGTLRGQYRFAFEAKDRQLEYKRTATATAGPAERAEPLTVSFRTPSDQTGVRDPSLIVTGTATSSKGIARVVMTLNGAEVHRQSESGAPRSVVVSVPVTFVAGPNTLTLTAAEPDGTVRQDVRTVTFTPGSTGPVAPPAPVTRQQWAVIIGAGQYHSAAIPRLRYTVPDAEAVYRTLTGPGGFPKDNVVLLTDNAERKPTLRNIRWALGTFLARSARKDDTVVIFFAGHGAPEADLRGAERDGLAKYLIPVDADPDDLYSTALPMDEIKTIFERIEAERVVAFLDACYSGAAGGRTFASLKTRAGSLDDLFLERLTRSKGRAIITASRPTEVSIELTELGHGIFTYYLVQGLQGAADGNRDGIVSLQELYEFVEQQVGKKSRAVGGNQHPVMKGEMEGALPLVKVPPRRP
jgi:Caspase domain